MWQQWSFFVLDHNVEKLKEKIRIQFPNLSDEEVDRLGIDLMLLAKLSIEDFIKKIRSP